MAKEQMKCEMCGTTENLTEHHISYEPEVIQILCSRCHGKLHWDKRMGSQLSELERLGVKIKPEKANNVPKSKLELFDELTQNALNNRCACKVCYALREAYMKELKSKIPEDVK